MDFIVENLNEMKWCVSVIVKKWRFVIFYSIKVDPKRGRSSPKFKSVMITIKIKAKKVIFD